LFQRDIINVEAQVFVGVDVDMVGQDDDVGETKSLEGEVVFVGGSRNDWETDVLDDFGNHGDQPAFHVSECFQVEGNRAAKRVPREILHQSTKRRSETVSNWVVADEVVNGIPGFEKLHGWARVSNVSEDLLSVSEEVVSQLSVSGDVLGVVLVRWWLLGDLYRSTQIMSPQSNREAYIGREIVNEPFWGGTSQLGFQSYLRFALR